MRGKVSYMGGTSAVLYHSTRKYGQYVVSVLVFYTDVRPETRKMFYVTVLRMSLELMSGNFSMGFFLFGTNAPYYK